ncbi:MAG TPA: hypothetical protein VKA60_01225 [Blastocatellia bacterium]|nr:hypothetical protein [Blastocatellia bacterium]
MSDDPTKNVDSSAMPPTQPTLETILERINALGERMDAKLTEIQGQMNELREGQEKIKNELWALRTGFARSYGDLMVGQEMHERRISDLEKKVS